MKKVIRILVVTLLFTLWGTAPVLADSTWPAPMCYPTACPTK